MSECVLASYKSTAPLIIVLSNLPVFGFGPVVQDGFGIGYIIRDAGLQYSISSKHRQTKRYANMLNQTLIDMGKLLGPKHSISVSCDTIPESNSHAPKPPEYLEGFDFFGQHSPSTPDLTAESSSPGTLHHRVSGGSSSFARVLRRQSSYTATQLNLFGEEISSPLGHISEH